MADSRTVVFESFGVTAELAVVDRADPAPAEDLLPPGWRRGDPARADKRFVLDEHTAPGAVAAQIRAHVAFNAPEHIFIHSGMVVQGDRAILLPGSSISGKTTLVAALVRAGAAYGSDEFALLDRDGLVHPFPKPLSLRAPASYQQVDVTLAEFGGEEVTQPVRAGLIAITSYVWGALWRPSPLSQAQGALALLAHTVVARSRPVQAMAAIGRTVSGATIVQSPRGESEEVVEHLLSATAAA